MPGFTAFVRIDLRKFLIKYGVLKNFGSIVTEIFQESLFLKNNGIWKFYQESIL